MITGGKEVIIGMSKDPQFGQLMMFGLGGIYVEVLKDVSFRLAPLTMSEADAMIHEIKAFPLLTGIRGEMPSDLQTLRETIIKVSQLVMDFPQIVSAEFSDKIATIDNELTKFRYDVLITVNKLAVNKHLEEKKNKYQHDANSLTQFSKTRLKDKFSSSSPR